VKGWRQGAAGRRIFVAHRARKGVHVTEEDRREGTEEAKDNAKDESEEATKPGDRKKGGAEDVNPEGEGTSGGVKENVQDEFDEAQQD
jgi:hypothetical protein